MTPRRWLRALLACSLVAGCGGGSSAPEASAAAAPDGGDAIAEVGPEVSFSAMTPDGGCIENAFKRQGACTCQDGFPTPCETACTDLAIDDDNCGACGHACAPRTTCIRGVCGTPPVTVLPAPAACGAMRLAGQGDALYWTDTAAGKVMRMPAAGGAPTPVSGAETSAPTLLELKGGAVFWLDGKTIRKSVAGAVSEVYASPDDIHGLAASDDAGTVYFSAGAKIEGVAAAGGAAPADVEVQNTGTPVAIAVSGDSLTFTLDANTGGVDVIRRSGPLALCWTMDAMGSSSLDVNCTRIAREAGGASPADILVATGSTVIWITYNSAIRVGDLSGGVGSYYDAVNLNGITTISSFASASGFVYFGTDDGTIQQVPVAPDGTAVRLARGVQKPGSIAVAGHSVFWSTADCSIQSTPAGD
jgi:hypothetical protein